MKDYIVVKLTPDTHMTSEQMVYSPGYPYLIELKGNQGNWVAGQRCWHFSLMPTQQSGAVYSLIYDGKSDTVYYKQCKRM